MRSSQYKMGTQLAPSSSLATNHSLTCPRKYDSTTGLVWSKPGTLSNASIPTNLIPSEGRPHNMATATKASSPQHLTDRGFCSRTLFTPAT